MRFDLAALAKRAGVKRKVIECGPIEPKVGVEKEYRGVLTSMLNEAAGFVKSDILPYVEAERSLLTRDDVGDRLTNRFQAFRALLDRLRDVASGMARRIFELENARHETRFRETVRSALGVDVGVVLAAGNLDEVVATRILENARLIQSLSDDIANRVQQAILANLIEGGTAKTLAKTLNEQIGITKRRAGLIARDQTAKFTSDLNRARQDQAGIDKYRWSTSKDERVRPTHRENEGKIFSWKDPPAKTGHPGHDINCRCVAIAVIEIE